MDYTEQRLLWEQKYPDYQKFAVDMSGVIHEILEAKHIISMVHQIAFRAKSPDRFEEKCHRKNYSDPFEQMKDLAGVRVITLYEADVARVAEAITSSLFIDAEHSHIKAPVSAKILSYRTIHLVGTLTEEYLEKADLKGYAGMNIEIQVRSVLQHAWAEIDHDSRYKSNFVLPPELERRLYLIAGLLEVADREFNDFRDQRNKLIEEAKKEITEQQLSSELLTLVFIEASLELIATKYHLGDHYIKDDASKLIGLCEEYGITKVGDYITLLDDLDDIFQFSRVVKSSISAHVRNYNRKMSAGFVIFSAIILRRGIDPWCRGMPLEWIHSINEALAHFRPNSATRIVKGSKPAQPMEITR
ncbi:MAG: hypothetical protein CVV64_07320 [Candidatus Wallbacteria bacterium HGW-Wallbacteria-1]|uniref:RelA/SpoT domain-containing protein n=1 Tax=Candidatus Wallbacteria bacterium HGW-Wallbacteria-1 TaxID=2013854 RepID=A0A2N1PQR0_9BACT|nr:MAG: hypothetical protein CVV64_07320 [Candidatus Wallbacteria bacterium HGW-Wallbacteria-1]